MWSGTVEILSGGEPLHLGNDSFDMMDILHDDGTSFVIITNGFLLRWCIIYISEVLLFDNRGGHLWHDSIPHL